MEDYFKPRKRKVHVDLTKDSTNEATNSKKKKEYEKRIQEKVLAHRQLLTE